VRALTNRQWGFESNCFVCEPSNESGLRIPFFHDEQTEQVQAAFSLGAEYSGAPSYIHGGIVLAIMDEAMAWATIALAHRFAVTAETNATFSRPLRVGRRYRVSAQIVSTADDRDRILTRAEVVDDRDRLCAAAEARFTPLGPAQAADAVGAEVPGVDASYLRWDKQ